jgi:hypothetical protein
MPEVLQQRCCYLLLLLAGGDGLLLACLLLLDLRLTTCPSPPGLDLELQYILIVLLDDF